MNATYGRKAWHISAYTYRAETLCPDCMHAAALGWSDTTPAAVEIDIETLLDQVAAYRLIEREDESTYDSDEFPKIVFSSSIESDETCDHCGTDLY